MAERELLLAWWLLRHQNSPAWSLQMLRLQLWLGPTPSLSLLGSWGPSVSRAVWETSGHCLSRDHLLLQHGPRGRRPVGTHPTPENPSHATEGAQGLTDKPCFPVFLHLGLLFPAWAWRSEVRCADFPAALVEMEATHRGSGNILVT